MALTFDDGPDPDATPAVLDALDEIGVKATFFMVGEQVMQHRALAREVADRGHEVALHAFEHREHSEFPGRSVADDLARGLGAVEVATGRRPALYRPPYGRFSEASHAACGDLGLEPVYWSAWGMDWEAIPAERIAELALRDLEPGAIRAPARLGPVRLPGFGRADRRLVAADCRGGNGAGSGPGVRLSHFERGGAELLRHVEQDLQHRVAGR